MSDIERASTDELVKELTRRTTASYSRIEARLLSRRLPVSLAPGVAQLMDVWGCSVGQAVDAVGAAHTAGEAERDARQTVVIPVQGWQVLMSIIRDLVEADPMVAIPGVRGKTCLFCSATSRAPYYNPNHTETCAWRRAAVELQQTTGDSDA